MAVVVTNIGSSSTVAGGAVTITVGAGGVPAGSQIFVAYCENSAASTPSAADTAGNTYNRNGTANTGIGVYQLRAKTGLALVNGNTIVVTLSSGATLAAADAFYVTGLANVNLDVSNTATGSSALPSVTSPTPSQSGDLFVGVVAGASLVTSFTQDSTNAAWASPPGSVSNAAPVLGGGNVVNPAASALTYAPTFGNSDVWAAIVVSYVPAPLLDLTSLAGKFSQARQYSRFLYNHGCDVSGPLPTQPGSEPSLVVVTYDAQRPSVVVSSRLFYEAGALDVPPAPQVETNPHFLGRFRPAAYGWLRFQQQGSEAAVVAETNQNFLARYRQEQRYSRFGYQGLAIDPTVVAVVAETNQHFLARYRQEQRYGRFSYQGLATDPATAAAVVDDNVHFLGRYRPVAYLVPTYFSVCDASSAQPGSPSSLVVVTYDTPRPSVAVSSVRYYQSESLDVSVLQPETPTHFLARYRPASYARFAYNHGSEFSGPIGPQPESNTHFVPPFTPVAYSAFRNNVSDVSGASTAQADTNVHFLARYRPDVYSSFRYERTGSAASGPLGPQPETNTHFLARFRPAVYARYAYNFSGSDLSGPPPAQPETNVNTIGRFAPVRLAVPQLLRSNIAADLTQPQPETNVHFLARFRQVVYSRFAYQHDTTEVSAPPPPQPETNVHLLARFSPVAYTRFPYNVQDHDAPVSETNTHFLARYRPAQLGSLIGNRSNVAADSSQQIAETNVNTIGTFRRPPVTLLQSLWNNQADDTQIIVPETNQHFIGLFRPATTRRFAYNYGSEQGPPPAIQPESAVSFIGRFSNPRYAIVPMYMFQNSRMTPSPLEPDAAQAGSVGVYRAYAWSQ